MARLVGGQQRFDAPPEGKYEAAGLPARDEALPRGSGGGPDGGPGGEVSPRKLSKLSLDGPSNFGMEFYKNVECIQVILLLFF